jgi:alkanesulfonate monooxygenase SsuD/methylene tetrahydromethanopterin reductase-like flavin-dependent oxidoreductase (luciferase family)
MAKIQFGWFTPPLGIEESGYVPLAIAEQREILPVVARHFDSLWVPDHLYAFGNESAPFLECWTTITWLAARFPTMKVGPLVMAVGFRHPPLLAKMAATLQALSAGRCIMAIGAGWREEEYPAYGYEYPRHAVRLQQLEEAVHIMRLMWTEQAPTFKGEYFQIANAYCAPLPMPPPPLMIGGTGERILSFIARVADIWDLYHWERQDNVDLDAYRRKRDTLREAAAAADRDPASIMQSLSIGQAKLPQSSTESEQWLEHLAPLIELGVRQFILDCGHVTATDPVERFAEEVIAVVNKDRA